MGFFMFSFAAVMESILVENTKIKLQIQYKAMLTHSYKLASLGEMAGGVAHEINNPLTVIQLHSDAFKRLFNKGELDQAAVGKRIEAITNSVNRIVKVITNLRYFSRDASQDPMTEASIQSVIDQTLTFCKLRFMEKGVEIKSRDIPDLKVRCRPAQLAQALLNILNNSFEAVVRDSHTEKVILLEVSEVHQEALIRITDSGPGIPQDIRDRIFDPFFSTKDIGEGMGLGLSVSMGMIESQNGRLKLDETSEQTCFVIQLPLVPGERNLTRLPSVGGLS
jgi:C4-dicarboxylate-specific signal transduction histidine kinase